MLNRVYWPTRLMSSHQSHETVSSRNRSRRNQRTLTHGVVHRVLSYRRTTALVGRSHVWTWPVRCGFGAG